MDRRRAGFSLVEIMIALAITAVIVGATYAVVAAVVKGDDDARIRVQLQMEATNALRKISDLLKMSGPTGSLAAAPGPNDYPIFALDQNGGAFTGNNAFINSCSPQTPVPGEPDPVTDDGVGHLAPPSDSEGYSGVSNEIAFKLPRPQPWYYPLSPPPGKIENPLDNTGVPVDLSGATTWGVSTNLFNYIQATFGAAQAQRQTDVYAIVLVPTVSAQVANGVPVPGPNQLELREYSFDSGNGRKFIRKTVLATGVERILFSAPQGSVYYQTGNDPVTGAPFQTAGLGQNQLQVTIWMWRNSINANLGINAYRAKATISVNLRSVGQNQTAN
jgi:prepilin-type N-terminal cleavage/methylation domain-containing protein